MHLAFFTQPSICKILLCCILFKITFQQVICSFVLVKIYVRIYKYFIDSLVDGHLGCLWLLALVNKAAMNICIQVFLWHVFLLFLNKYPVMEFLGYMESKCLII